MEEEACAGGSVEDTKATYRGGAGILPDHHQRACRVYKAHIRQIEFSVGTQASLTLVKSIEDRISISACGSPVREFKLAY
jgi:hypothetical protein